MLMCYSHANLMRGDQMTSTEAEAAGRALARWLAPYLREELGELGNTQEGRGSDATAQAFVAALGDVVVQNALTFFRLLASQREVTSLEVAEAIGVGTPRNIPAVLTTPLK